MHLVFRKANDGSKENEMFVAEKRVVVELPLAVTFSYLPLSKLASSNVFVKGDSFKRATHQSVRFRLLEW